MNNDLLLKEEFTCCKCKNSFNATEGSWLPIGTENDNFMSTLSGNVKNPPMVHNFSMKPPEIITSDEFTCYNCEGKQKVSITYIWGPKNGETFCGFLTGDLAVNRLIYLDGEVRDPFPIENIERHNNDTLEITTKDHICIMKNEN